MPQDYSQFADLLAKYLHRADRSQGWLAGQLSCHASQVNRWLNGGQRPGDKETIWKIERAFNLSHDEVDALLVAANYPRRYGLQPARTALRDFSPPNPLMNFEEELRAFRAIVTGQDTQTRLILVHGESGTGKSRLLIEYRQAAIEHDFRVLFISLAQQISVEDCLHQTISCFDPRCFSSYNEFLEIDRPEPLTRKERDWQHTLTRRFFADLSAYTEAVPLVIFFDQYEKADRAFKEWLSRIYLPGIFTLPLTVVVAGQEEIARKPAWPNQRHFHLDGLSVEWFHRYVAECNIYMDPYLINEFHKLLRGHPKPFVDYVRAELESRSLQ